MQDQVAGWKRKYIFHVPACQLLSPYMVERESHLREQTPILKGD
jgi:hypothetical protein